MGIETTVRPARYRFLEIANAYAEQGLALPEEVEDGYLKFERVISGALHEMRCHLWDFWE